MEAEGSSETVVPIYHATRHHSPDDRDTFTALKTLSLFNPVPSSFGIIWRQFIRGKLELTESGIRDVIFKHHVLWRLRHPGNSISRFATV
jgi:hypothetical protein